MKWIVFTIALAPLFLGCTASLHARGSATASASHRTASTGAAAQEQSEATASSASASDSHQRHVVVSRRRHVRVTAIPYGTSVARAGGVACASQPAQFRARWSVSARAGRRGRRAGRRLVIVDRAPRHRIVATHHRPPAAAPPPEAEAAPPPAEPEVEPTPEPAPPPATPPENEFGYDQPVLGCFEGTVYPLKKNTRKLPADWSTLEPASVLYACEWDIAERDWQKGFPEIDNRFEWFGIRYAGRFRVTQDGEYTFRINSDDGTKMYVDGQLVLDNDGAHPPKSKSGKVTLTAGDHDMVLEYFQGPRYHIALQVYVKPPGGEEGLFSVRP